MRMWVQSLALLSGAGIHCCHELWCKLQVQLRSVLLWHRPAAAVPIPPLAWELPYAAGLAVKKKKKKKQASWRKPMYKGCMMGNKTGAKGSDIRPCLSCLLSTCVVLCLCGHWPPAIGNQIDPAPSSLPTPGAICPGQGSHLHPGTRGSRCSTVTYLASGGGLSHHHLGFAPGSPRLV